jgi:hypothetical protein
VAGRVVVSEAIPDADGLVSADQDAVIFDALIGEGFAAGLYLDVLEEVSGAVVLNVALIECVVHGFCFFVFVVGLISFDACTLASFASRATSISQIVRIILLSVGACRVATAGAETRAAPR